MEQKLLRRLWVWIGLSALVLLLGTCTVAVIIPGVELGIRESQAPTAVSIAQPTHSATPGPTHKAAPVTAQSPATVVKSTPTPTPAATPTSAVAGATALTGLGATDAEWAAAHQAAQDPRLQAGCCYDPDPSLPQVKGRIGYRYTDVQHRGGRVFLFTHNFRRSTTEALGEREVMSLDFPRDARVVWSKRKDTCFQEQLQSDTLAKGWPDSHGMALIELETKMGSYDTTNVTVATVQPGSYGATEVAC